MKMPMRNSIIVYFKQKSILNTHFNENLNNVPVTHLVVFIVT